jgi:hypothetical protein
MCESFVHRAPQEGGNAVYLVMRMPRRGVDSGAAESPRAAVSKSGVS